MKAPELPFKIREEYANSDFITGVEMASDPDYIEYKNEMEKWSNCQKTILSLFDFSGSWSAPYRDAGYNVVQFDLKHGQDILDMSPEYLLDVWGFGLVYGILAAVPCTEFAGSGARWFKEKDKDGRTELAIKLVNYTLQTIEFFDPVFWAIENPVGRIRRLIPELDVKPWYFNPSDFARDYPGEEYTKKTGLWGKFVPPTLSNLGDDRSVKPVLGSIMHTKYGGKSESTKTARSITPCGFSQAFFECNR